MYTNRTRRLDEPDHERGLPQGADRASASAGSARGGPMSPAAARSLQRTMGNAAVARLVERERRPDHAVATQRLADDGAVESDALAQADAVTRSAGSPLRADVQRAMEGDFGGEDFSDVRVHIDRDSAEALGARAYTTKTNRIVFRSAADMDDHTMRHELQHVRQQRVGKAPSGVSHPTDALEQDAERTAAELGRGATSVQRAGLSEHTHTQARDSTVQRMVSKASGPLFKTWAEGGPPITTRQKEWVLAKLAELADKREPVSKMTSARALELLEAHGVTRATMEADMGQSPSAAPQHEPAESREQYDERARDTVLDADQLWRDQERSMPTLETATFHIEGLGRGTVGMLKSPSKPRHSGMLAWFSHGYQDQHTISIDTARKYGFAVEQEQSLNRIGASAEDFASLPDAFADSGMAATKDAPGEYVQPHHASELKLEIGSVIGLVQHCDVAVLLDFQWDDTVAEAYVEARKAETPPLPVIIENAPAFQGYDALLIYACRTPWSVNVAVEGSGRLKEAFRKELMADGLSADAAAKKVQERYEGAPQRGVVHE